MNLADDDELLRMMQKVDFRFVFMGIETPDPDLLAVTQKKMNSMKPIVERVHHVYEHGISISAGFILGFDNEKPGIRDAMIECIEETGIMVAMVGLLSALPNTQLTRRLMREGRMINSNHQLLPPSSDGFYRLEYRKCGQYVGRTELCDNSGSRKSMKTIARSSAQFTAPRSTLLV